MEPLAETPWDVTISGTGLAQSLLALALSRSGKKVLHVDQNSYYGASEAAFSLQEAQEWASKVNGEPEHYPFEDATVYLPEGTPQLPPRSYTLTLSPHLIYSNSRLLPTLVASKVYRQLEFQAVGSWWIHKTLPDSSGTDGTASSSVLYRVPGSREDVFADDIISVKSKRTLMRFLRHIGKPPQDGDSEAEEEDLATSLPEYLASKFQVPAELHEPLLSLSLSQASPGQTSAEYAVPRIKRHLASIGVYGPGFGSLLAKWGGGSEIAQVGCRALAVGGGVYVLNAGVESISNLHQSDNGDDMRVQLHLSNDETIKTKLVVGSNWDLPGQERPACDKVARSITVVSSPLESLFPVTAEGGPIPAGAVVVFPGSSFDQSDDLPPVYLLVHSSETGECPSGQCVVYGSVNIAGAQGQSLIEDAVHRLLQSNAEPDAKVLWSLRYTQLGLTSNGASGRSFKLEDPSPNILCFPPPSLDLAFDDALIDRVKDAWKLVMGDEANEQEFMNFEDREHADDED
ncbi:GDP dissociation inhibitor [Aspergillus pseudonomiae]|uniref:Rab proteins geranylgeranyltransferase n=1 Tax=Aspergillus pseudonomiae TaxID=1506151 RepID=A0A5N7DG77_9EURO|nr:GDP dissociation inhibitor [Aspergillus pseudonomiae]KAB8253680.1 GDP dissociation inhibitor [Aspergillus pseudonomiae]KAE8404658.1 GDP dissociation inhibitor [Aspergillus pseudonomiae]